MKVIVTILRIVVAIVLIQTLRFKFTGHEDSIYIFTKVGMEPWGRIGTGIAELVAATFLLIPRTAWLGALMTLGIIGGAILMHLTILGIEINGDSGFLFYQGILVFILAACILWYEKDQLNFIKKFFNRHDQ